MEKTRRHFILNFNGYSMYPFLKPGDRLIVSKVPMKSLQIGDVVIVPDLSEQYVAHRLVRMLPPDKCINSRGRLPPAQLRLVLSGIDVVLGR